MRAFYLWSMAGLLAWAALSGPVQADDPKVSKSGDTLKGDTKKVGDLAVTPVKTGPLPCVFWADAKGTAFYTIDSGGTIRRISFPDLKETVQAELQSRCSWLAPSAEGLVVSVTESQEVWLLDEATFKVKQKIPVPSLKRAVSAAPLSVGVASTDSDLYDLDFKKKTSRKYAGEKPKSGGYADPVITPDGKSVYTAGGIYNFNRWGIVSGQLKYLQSSPGIHDGSTIRLLQVSSDSKYVWLGSYTGNNGADRGMFIYKSNNIETAEFTIKPNSAVAGVDAAGGYVYGAHPRSTFKLYSMKGELQKEHKLDGSDPKQILVHPEGNKLLFLQSDRFLLIEVPKQK